jgi:4-hydroxymandelate oxidase
MALDIDALEAAARERLDPGAYDFFASGSGSEQTVAANLEAWQRLALLPHALRDVREVSSATTVLGTTIAFPVLAAPVAVLGMAHPDAEPAVAAAAAAAGTLYVLSSRTSTAVGAVAAAAPRAPWWFQVYVMRDRGLTAELVERAVRAGAGALVLTGDTPRVGRKRRPGPDFDVPVEVHMPDLARGEDLRGDPRLEQDAGTSLEDVAWLAALSGLPVVVKGVLRGDDARECLEAGAAAVVVSNHGGRQLDGAIATAAALPEVVDAVAGEAEVYVDGGVRSGSDVLRALALGARAVLIGRPLAWALAAGGSDGVRALLGDVAAEVEEALALAGVRSPAEVTVDLLAP